MTKPPAACARATYVGNRPFGSDASAAILANNTQKSARVILSQYLCHDVSMIVLVTVLTSFKPVK